MFMFCELRLFIYKIKSRRFKTFTRRFFGLCFMTYVWVSSGVLMNKNENRQKTNRTLIRTLDRTICHYLTKLGYEI